MTHVEGMIRGADGASLHAQSWHPGPNARAAVAIVHGHGEHGGRYENVVRVLLACGCAVYSLDLRGHGRSPGQRGHIGSWAEYRGDVGSLLRWISEREASRPIFLLGHSMGALVVLDYLLDDQGGIAGAILSGAPIEPVGIAKPYLVRLSRALSRVCPRFPLRLALDTTALSRDAAVVRAYVEDPLVHGRFSARWGTESLAAVARVNARAAEITTAILFLHGEADRLNRHAGVRRFFERVGSADKRLRIYPGMYHELHNDIGREPVLKDLEEWITARTR